MSNRKIVPRNIVTGEMARGVAQACLCLHVQRAARALARHFDDVFRPLGITGGQYSLLMSLNRPMPPTITETADFLAMDRTTLTAALKALLRRGLVSVESDTADKRIKRIDLTAAGRAVLTKAYALWAEEHGEIEARVAPSGAGPLRRELKRLVEDLGKK
jgi:DNA-binding MarR family transcriptional regulator